jgi:hypothetical protein
MSWILSNWVERRAARERNLKNAFDLWKKVQAAVGDACESLKEHYPDVATIQRTKQNGDLLTITITRPPKSEMQADETPRATVVTTAFQSDERSITVTVDHGMAREFLIEADSDHAFISLQGRELLLDEFSRIVLEEAFFTRPESPSAYKRLRLVR